MIEIWINFEIWNQSIIKKWIDWVIIDEFWNYLVDEFWNNIAY